MTKKGTDISQDRYGAAGGKRPAGIWQPRLANDISALNGGEAHGRYRMHGKRRRRDRRSANAASAGGADAVCRYDATLRGLGWIVAGLRHPVSGARFEFCGLSRGPEARRYRLQ